MSIGTLSDTISPLSGLEQLQPRGAVNFSMQVIFAATNVPQLLPPLHVPPGLSVTLGGTTPNGNNLASASAAYYPEQVGGAGAYLIAPGGSVTLPVDNLGRIWVVGTKGDGLAVSMRGASIG
jgi:hypothetical protein